jgi:helicase
MEEAVDNIVRFLWEEGMVRCPGTEMLALEPEADLKGTFFGKRVSDLYIDPMSAVKLRDGLLAYVPGEKTLGFLHAVCSTPDMMTLFLKRDDFENLTEVVLDRKEEMLFMVPDMETPDYEYFLAELKTALVLDSWIAEKEEEDIFRAFGTGPGDIHNKVEIGEWLLYSMRELSNIFNKDCYPILTKLMTRMRYGVREDLLELVELKGVGRARARSLHKRSLTTWEKLREADVHDISSVIGIGDVLAERIKRQVDPGFVPNKSAKPRPAKGSEPPVRKEPKEVPKKGQTKLLDF